MYALPASLKSHRIQSDDVRSVCEGRVTWEPVRSLWFTAMALGTLAIMIEGLRRRTDRSAVQRSGGRRRAGHGRAVHIAASPDVVWRQIHHATDIRADEVGHAWMYCIGVPLPLAGISEDRPDGRVRRITMGKDIHFEQVVLDWEEHRRVHWNYRFAVDSFPPRALDDRVMIGGHHFDLIDSSYKLQPTASGTQLRIRMG